MNTEGTYGIKKPASITSSDVDIYYYYRKDTSVEYGGNGEWKKLDSNLLKTMNFSGLTLPGAYSLNLPLEVFGNVGIYNVYITPREYSATILDVSELLAFPGVRGIVLDTEDAEYPTTDGSLVGYRVEYLDTNGNRSMDRIITMNGRCEPAAQNLSNTVSKGIRYRFNNSGGLIFCTLSPSTAMSFKSDSLPYIGKVGETVKIVSTKFNPVMLEINMVDKDISTISTMLEGKQIRNKDKGLITTFNSDGEIYHQAQYGIVTDGESNYHYEYKVPNSTAQIDTEEKDQMENIEEKL